MKKVYLGIFICFASILLMSQNVGAIEPIFDIGNYDLVFDQINPTYSFTYNDGATLSQNQARLSSSRSQVISMQYPVFSYKKGDIIQTDFIVYDNGSTFTTGQTASGSLTSSIFLPYINYSNDFAVLDVQEVVFHDINKLINYYQSISCNQSGTGTSCETFPEISITTSYYQVFRITLKVKKDLALYNLVLNSSTTFPLFDFSSWNFNYDIRIKPTRWNIWRPVQTKEEEAADKEIESSENIENQTPPSSSETGDGAQATNLINAFGGFVSALGGLSATNCNLTLNFPEFAGGSRVVNVCQNKDKAGNIISVFSSLTLIVFYVPLAIRLLTMIYNEIRSFTNG